MATTTVLAPVSLSDAATAARTLIRLVHALESALKKKGRPEALALTDISTLAAIDRGIIFPTAIARDIHVDPARVSRVVEHLVCLGFVERLTSADDRRQCPLALTTAGKERLELGRADVRHFMVEVLNTLSEVDREGFTRNLREIGEYLAVHQG